MNLHRGVSPDLPLSVIPPLMSWGQKYRFLGTQLFIVFTIRYLFRGITYREGLGTIQDLAQLRFCPHSVPMFRPHSGPRGVAGDSLTAIQNADRKTSSGPGAYNYHFCPRGEMYGTAKTVRFECCATEGV